MHSPDRANNDDSMGSVSSLKVGNQVLLDGGTGGGNQNVAKLRQNLS
jgi:hypothetical protein